METIEDLQYSVGTDLEPSEWFEIDQDRVNTFASATLDFAFTHVDPEKAKPLGGTTAHGLLLLSLVPYLAAKHSQPPEGCTTGLNYGFDRVRITSPVKVGQRVRLRPRLAGFGRHGEAWWKKTLAMTLEVENQEKPALLADWIIVYR